MHTSTEQELMRAATEGFARQYGVAPEVVRFAPGRVNLLGEHTDYNGGFVLPMPLGLGVAIALGRGGAPGEVRLASGEFAGEERRRVEESASGAWSDYILGSLKALVAGEMAETGLKVFIDGNLPLGAGLSSSAAVEVCTLRVAAELFGKQIDPVDVALMARAVENDFVGMPCGIMDQFAISVGRPGAALFLDTRKLEYRRARLPEDYNFVVIHSGVSHKLTDDGYATRVAECHAACAALGVEMLSDLGAEDLPRIGGLEAPMDGRARHIVTENQRVLDGLEALERGDTATFGALMIASHASQRDDYALSVPEVDALVEGALEAGAVGARLTGGGFGGSVVALVAEAKVEEFCDEIHRRLPITRVLAVT